MNEFRISVIEMNSMESFWAQIDEPDYKRTLDDIHQSLNGPGAYAFRPVSRDDMYEGLMVVALFVTEDSADFYRAKITHIDFDWVEVRPLSTAPTSSAKSIRLQLSSLVLVSQGHLRGLRQQRTKRFQSHI